VWWTQFSEILKIKLDKFKKSTSKQSKVYRFNKFCAETMQVKERIKFVRAKNMYGPSHGFAWFFTRSIESLYTLVCERSAASPFLGLIFIASDILLLDYDTKKREKAVSLWRTTGSRAL